TATFSWEGTAMDAMDQQGNAVMVDVTNWKQPQNLHWSFQHMADFLPTASIARGSGPVAELPAAHRDLDSVLVPGTVPGQAPVSVGAVMASTNTDGWMLLHRGQVLTEQYFGQ